MKNTADDRAVALGEAQNLLRTVAATMASNVLNAQSDKEVVREIWRAHLLQSFARSWQTCWDQGLYFANEPEDITLRLLSPNREAIAEIAFYDWFTLFEAAILIDQRTGTCSFLADSWLIFVDAIAANQLMPRHPDNYLRWVDLPLHQQRQIPDLTWVISRDELYCFASALYPAHLFADLRVASQAEDEPKTARRFRSSTLAILNAYRTRLSQLNRNPENIEVWRYLIFIAGHPDNGVAEFLDVETDDGNGVQGRIIFDSADGGLTVGITFKTLQNRLAELRKSGKI